MKPYILAFYSNGYISCFDENSLKEIVTIQLEEHILSVDVEGKQVVIATKSKNNSLFLYNIFVDVDKMEEIGK